ncbi:MAG: hypothetical protein LUQ04_06535 [Methanoregula sp.]|nr:hypothetical protein [Methanoregula sp.]
MNLKKYRPSSSQIQSLIGDGCYQPFIFSDEFISGIGYSWVTGELIIAMDKANDIAYRWQAPNMPLKRIKNYITDENWELFVDCNTRLRNMYDSWINHTLNALDFPLDYSVVDTASNAGYFLYKFKEKEAGTCIGYDLLDFSNVFSTLNTLTGYNVKFFNKSYDMTSHTIPDSSPADIVISCAIMCHLSDPLNYLAFLGSITKKALLLFTSVDDTDTFQIIYDGAKAFYPDARFPNCFDANTRISKGVLLFGLKELGFSEIIELPYSDLWIPLETYKKFKTIVALKE